MTKRMEITHVCPECGRTFNPWRMTHVLCSRECAAKSTGRKKTDKHLFNLRSLIAGATPDTCIEWPGTKNQSGYGYVSLHDRNQIAHRLVYRLAHGPIPDGLQIMHSCDNPGCVNPHHLRPGTGKENIQDAVRKGRRARCGNPGQPRLAIAGERHCWAKLTEEQVRLIRSMSKASRRQLAEQFGVSIHLIASIRARRAWRHVP